VVVVEEDRRTRVAVQLLDDRSGKCRIDGGVTLFPGRAEVAIPVVLQSLAVLDNQRAGLATTW
jgi:hypothetical protein